MPIGLASLVLVTRHFHVPVTRAPLRLDYAVVVLLSIALLGLLALVEGGGVRFEWASPEAALLLGVSLSGLGLFVWRETRATDPLVPLRLFSQRPYAGTAALTVASLLLTRLDQNNATPYVLFAGMVAGAGLGMCNNAITVAAQNAIPMRDLGVGTSSLSLIRSMGQTIGVAAATAVLTTTFRDLVPEVADPAALDQVRQSAGPVDLDAVKDTAPALFDAFVEAMSQALAMPRRELRTSSGAQQMAAEAVEFPE